MVDNYSIRTAFCFSFLLKSVLFEGNFLRMENVLKIKKIDEFSLK